MGRRSRVVSVATRAGKTPGAFGDFEEDEPVYPEVLGDDDAPTASGEFASKLSLELRARGMDANGDGAAEPTVSDDAPALDAPGLIARMRANRPGRPLSPVSAPADRLPSRSPSPRSSGAYRARARRAGPPSRRPFPRSRPSSTPSRDSARSASGLTPASPPRAPPPRSR